jgi:hypothetical protein
MLSRTQRSISLTVITVVLLVIGMTFLDVQTARHSICGVIASAT